jgi:hypothetical protein
MKAVYRRLGWATLRGIAWLFAGSVRLGIDIARFRALRPILREDSIPCSTCSTAIPLLGLWECGRCGCSFYSWYFARCECCGDVPIWVSCECCQASTMNPFLFG